MSNYQGYIFAACRVDSIAVGNPMARLVGYKGSHDAFGNKSSVRLRKAGVDYFLHIDLAHYQRQPVVDEFNGPGPWPTLNAMGANDQTVTAAKAALIVEYIHVGPDTSGFDQESALAAFLSRHGLERVQ